MVLAPTQQAAMAELGWRSAAIGCYVRRTWEAGLLGRVRLSQTGNFQWHIDNSSQQVAKWLVRGKSRCPSDSHQLNCADESMADPGKAGIAITPRFERYLIVLARLELRNTSLQNCVPCVSGIWGCCVVCDDAVLQPTQPFCRIANSCCPLTQGCPRTTDCVTSRLEAAPPNLEWSYGRLIPAENLGTGAPALPALFQIATQACRKVDTDMPESAP